MSRDVRLSPLLVLTLLWMLPDVWGLSPESDVSDIDVTHPSEHSGAALVDRTQQLLIPFPQQKQLQILRDGNRVLEDVRRPLVTNSEDSSDEDEWSTRRQDSVINGEDAPMMRLKKGPSKDKGNDQRFRYNPGISMIGLGKRNLRNRPKYNPGWKLIGLGKRESLPSTDVMQMERRDVWVRTLRDFTPYLSFLAFNNPGAYLSLLQKEFAERSPVSKVLEDEIDVRSPPKNHSKLEFVKDVSGGQQGTGTSIFSRSRKPNRGWKSSNRPVYDPAWMLTGLGK